MDPVRYLILGTTEARDSAGVPVPLGGSRLRALLAALALHADRPVSAEALIAEVWGPDADLPHDASGALQALVSRLRRALGKDVVTSGPGGYRLLTGPGDVDLHVFERLAADGAAVLDAGDPEAAAGILREALALWRGPAYADLPDRTSAAARPEALRLTALHRRIDADLACGRAAESLPQLRELVADHPLDEPFHVQLIRALRAAHRSADALMAYEQARRTLADRLGADPGPELRALHAQLLSAQDPPEPKSTRAPQGNLRPRLTSFVGREAELREIRADVARSRLVTLTGPGGSGKTRLSEEAGAALAGSGYPDGVWIAELAPLEHPEAVPQAVLSALGRRDTTIFGVAREGIKGSGGGTGADAGDPTARLLEHCAHRRLLLVLDNCEHVIGAAAELAAELLGACPGVTVLATSREPLGVPGETVRPVEPLSPTTAHRLFAERAAAVRPGFDTEQDVAAVDEICRRLDGLPLAIELAAARLRMLSPRQIADRLDNRFRLLTSGSRTLLPRQQTLRAVVDWSWDLLSEKEHAALRSLSVFAGGWTLAAAEAVVGGDDVIELIGQLVDKSLVVATQPGKRQENGAESRDIRPEDGVRYRFLETIHEYAAERARERPRELAEAARRHTGYFRRFVGTADPQLRTARQLVWLRRVEAELDNIRAALQRAITAGDEADALPLAVDMGWFWWLRNYREEGAGWLTRVTGMSEPGERDGPYFWARMDARLLLFFVSTDHASEEFLSAPPVQEAAALVAATYQDAKQASARFPGLLWPIASYVGGGHTAIRECTDVVVRNCRAHGDDWALAAALMFRTHVTIDLPGGLARATDDWNELTDLSGRVGDRWMLAQVHGARAEMEVMRGEYAAARADFEAALRLGEELGAIAEGPFLVGRMAELAIRSGDDAEAEKLCRRAEEGAERFGVMDARNYVRALSAYLSLRRGDVRRARELCVLARDQASQGTPPPVFGVVLAGLFARIAAAEGDLRDALARTAGAVRLGVESGCTESMVAGLLEYGAELLVVLGEPRAAARLQGASSALRGPLLPRTVPETVSFREAEAGARAALGEAGYEAARADGETLDLRAAADSLEASVLVPTPAGE
ncbi:BTAD domain-containing putative transcriptional regulator [Streptomyces sp. SPB162]|uniref:BTAD domain-containing putative transcriptional regulator n=1 Tax=Streptomyces sp. SPB162 TaxID=2940560 RepID=UPI0024052FE4|nr:BTAD domain-containing putative transcriptional regulator [Streptomyces sp. SPB162]MDF9814674.1 putative ATPase/DNA-binding SARP family transcriptional activator [Streptomyces sp. SPB162]